MSSRQLIDLAVQPLDVNSLLGHIQAPTKPGVDTFRFDYLKSELLRKYVSVDSTNDLLAPTLAVAREQEAKNRRINEDGFLPLRGRNLLLKHARRLAADILGDFSYDVYKSSRFSGGASTSRKYEFGAPYFKFGTSRSPLDVTPEAYTRANALLNLTNVWGSNEQRVRMKIVTSNEVSTVPKNAEIERTIGKEPDLNMMLQLGLGAGIRDALSLHGLNLDYSWQINQQMARQGSIDGYLATVDFANASASITDRVVWNQTPDDWYTELNAVRSKSGHWPDTGEHVKWEQFSSMGNGFTFELETLIFLTLAMAVMHEQGITPKIGHNVVVFGDDVILPATCYDRYTALCESIGFCINQKKSFKRGFFRESCGGYYFNGCDVKPFRIKEPVDTLPRVIWLLNAIRKWSSTNHNGSTNAICDPRLHEMYKGIYRRYRKHFNVRLSYYKKGSLRFKKVNITGGRDLNSSSSVVTPHKPMHSIILSSVSEQRNNLAAYSSVMQEYWVSDCKCAKSGNEISGIPIADRRFTAVQRVKTAYAEQVGKWVASSNGKFLLIKVDGSTGRYIRNRTGLWSVSVPVFLKELTGY